MPAAAALGTRLVSVILGMVFISNTKLSSFSSIIRSTLKFETSKALMRLTGYFLCFPAQIIADPAGTIYSVRPDVYLI